MSTRDHLCVCICACFLFGLLKALWARVSVNSRNESNEDSGASRFLELWKVQLQIFLSIFGQELFKLRLFAAGVSRIVLNSMTEIQVQFLR